ETQWTDSERTYVARKTTYGGTFHLHSAATPSEVRPPAQVEVRERGQQRLQAGIDQRVGQQATPVALLPSLPGRPEPRSPRAESLVQRQQRGFRSSALLIVLLLTTWMLSFFPWLVGWLFWFWPEQLALLGALGWIMENLPAAGISLIIVGAAGRSL